MCKIDSSWEDAVELRELSSGLCDDLERCQGDAEEAHQGRDVCIHMADSICCAAETNIAL